VASALQENGEHLCAGESAVEIRDAKGASAVMPSMTGRPMAGFEVDDSPARTHHAIEPAAQLDAPGVYSSWSSGRTGRTSMRPLTNE
jgi:hypothetical protein